MLLTKFSPHLKKKRLPLQITMIYSLFGFFWFWYMEPIADEVEKIKVIYSIRYSVYFTITAPVLYFLLYYSLKSIQNAEEKVRLFNEQLKAHFDHNADAIYIEDMNGTVLQVNEAFEHIFGWKKEEVIGRSLTTIPPLYHEENVALVQRIRSGEQIRSFETVRQRKDGSLINVNITASPIYNEMGKLIGMTKIARDVTQLYHLTEALRSTKEKLESFIQNTTDGIAILDVDGTITAVNQAFENMYGWKEAELKGKSFTVVAPADQDQARQFFQHVEQGGIVNGLEQKSVKKTGEHFFVSLTVSPIRDREGHVTALAATSRDISDKKSMEKALQDSEVKYRLIAENSTDLIRVWNVRGDITYASPSHESILGHSPSLIEQHGLIEFVHPDDKHGIVGFIQTIQMSGEPYEFEFRMRHQNGEWRTFESRSVPVFNENGDMIQILSVSRDVTKRKQTERELKKTKEQMESLIQHSAEAILVADQDGTILLVNPAAERIYGWTKTEFVGKNFKEFYSNTEYFTQTLGFHQQVLTTGRVVTYDAVRQHKNGGTIYLNTTLSPIPNELGKITAVSAITRDITKQKLAENALKKAQQDLHNTIHHFQGIIFKVIKDERGRLVHSLFDGQLLKDLNLHSDGIINRDIYEAFPQDIADYILPFYHQAWQGNDIHYEITLEKRHLFVSLKPVFRDHQVVEMVGSCVDVTKLKQTEELLQKSENLAMIGQLAAGIAHEIRNPLTTLKGFMQLYQKKMEDSGFDYMDLMLSEVERMEWITGEFLSLSKPQSSKILEHDLAKVLEHVKSFITPQAMLNNVEIFVEWDSSIPHVQCDENSIKQLFINLLKNAIESMPDGGQIHVIGNRELNYIHIQIQDEGCGIPEDRIASLGEPFYSLKEKGTGLGLMICFKIVEEHQGKMRITSEVGKGTTVTITFPYHRTDVGIHSSEKERQD